MEIIIVNKAIKDFQINIIPLLPSFLFLVKIPEMNSLESGVPWTIIFFLSNFIISAEMTSFSLVHKRYVDLLHCDGNSFNSSFSPLVTISRIYEILVYLCYFLLKCLRLLP